MLANLQTWLKKPFSPSNNATQWFAFVGLILVSIYLWHMIARDFSRLEPELGS